VLQVMERKEYKCPKCGRRAQGETFTSTKPGEAPSVRLVIRCRNPKRDGGKPCGSTIRQTQMVP